MIGGRKMHKGKTQKRKMHKGKKSMKRKMHKGKTQKRKMHKKGGMNCSSLPGTSYS